MSTLAPTTELRAEARAVGELLWSFIGQITHDLNNQLSQVLGKSELALMLGGEERFKTSLEQVHEAGHDARLLVADLQRVVTWTHNDDELVSVSEGLAFVERLIKTRCERAGIELEVGPASGRARSDQLAAVSLILWKLCSEALAAQTEAGSWSLSALQEAGGWGVQLAGPEKVWDAETKAALARAVRTGEELGGDVGVWLTALRTCNAQYRATDATHSIHVTTPIS